MVDYSLSAAHTVEELGSDCLSKELATMDAFFFFVATNIKCTPDTATWLQNNKPIISCVFLVEDKLELLDLLYCIANCTIDFSLSTDFKYIVLPFIFKLLDTIYV